MRKILDKQNTSREFQFTIAQWLTSFTVIWTQKKDYFKYKTSNSSIAFQKSNMHFTGVRLKNADRDQVL